MMNISAFLDNVLEIERVIFERILSEFSFNGKNILYFNLYFLIISHQRYSKWVSNSSKESLCGFKLVIVKNFLKAFNGFYY